MQKVALARESDIWLGRDVAGTIRLLCHMFLQDRVWQRASALLVINHRLAGTVQCSGATSD
jgi:hypothetical protein